MVHTAPTKYKLGKMRCWLEDDYRNQAVIIEARWLVKEDCQEGKARSSLVIYRTLTSLYCGWVGRTVRDPGTPTYEYLIGWRHFYVSDGERIQWQVHYLTALIDIER